MTDLAAGRAPKWAVPFWAVVGALVSFGTAGILTIGAPILIVGLALGGAGISRPQLRNRSMFGVLVGLALVAMYIVVVALGADSPTGSGSAPADQTN